MYKRVLKRAKNGTKGPSKVQKNSKMVNKGPKVVQCMENEPNQCKVDHCVLGPNISLYNLNQLDFRYFQFVTQIPSQTHFYSKNDVIQKKQLLVIKKGSQIERGFRWLYKRLS